MSEPQICTCRYSVNLATRGVKVEWIDPNCPVHNPQMTASADVPQSPRPSLNPPLDPIQPDVQGGSEIALGVPQGLRPSLNPPLDPIQPDVKKG